MTHERRALGREGEAQAERHMAGQGYRIVARNARADGVEIDLVAVRGNLVVFVEVKTRRTRRQGPAEEAVDRRKQARLVHGARAWLAAHGRPGLRARFDVIAVEPGPDGALRVRHWPNAFDASSC